MTIKFERVVPIFRIFSLEKAREFYIDFLGCKIDWEYRAPSQMLPFTCRSLVSGFTVHLIEHHGDGTPGSVAYVYTTGIAALHRELNDRKYRHNRPALEQMDWGMMQMTVIDPFGNRLCFGEPVEKRET